MKYFNLKNTALISSAFILLAPLALAQPAPNDEDEIVVTASRIKVTQGGAQDIEFFKTSVENGDIPAPAAITSEGLLSTYDLALPSSEKCDQLFCLVSETMPADFIIDDKNSHFVGLGFATNLTYENWERDPLTIVAVVDKSGSMGGEPLELAKASMLEVLSHLRDGDRMAVAQFGSTTDLVIPVTNVEDNREAIAQAISSIESSGSTYMEEGLELAFDTAFKAKKGFDGTSRVILFTDEQPNVGNTDAESFIGMARHASEKGVGLTTIGVADHFGADLANQVSAARGGNLFYVTNEADVKEVFGADFDLLTTEVAHDLELIIKPNKGVNIMSVYGVPGEDIKYRKNGDVSMTVPSVFLSTKGGGVFLGINSQNSEAQDFGKIELNYVEAKTDQYHEGDLKIGLPNELTSPPMALAHLLIDEYSALRFAAEASFFGGDVEQAVENLEKLQVRLDRFGDGVIEELILVEDFADLLIEQAESPEEEVAENCYYCSSIEPSPVHGKWRVTSVKNTTVSISGKGSIDIRKGDLMAFNIDRDRYDETVMFNLQRLNPERGEAKFEVESVSVNDQRRVIQLYESDIEFKYALSGDANVLRLYPEGTDLVLKLEPI